MDSLELITLKQLSEKIFRSYNGLRNEVKQDKSDPSQGTLHFHHGRVLRLRRLGRQWLVKKSDAAALLGETLLGESAQQEEPPTPAPARRPGRPRMAVKQGGAK